MDEEQHGFGGLPLRQLPFHNRPPKFAKALIACLNQIFRR